jgi:hypothetical protein
VVAVAKRSVKVAPIGGGMSGICMAAKSGHAANYLGDRLQQLVYRQGWAAELFPWTPDSHHKLLREPVLADFDLRTA